MKGLIGIEAMNWYVVGGGAHRHYGKDLDIRLKFPRPLRWLITFELMKPHNQILKAVDEAADVSDLPTVIYDLLGEEVPLDVGLTIYGYGEFKRTVLYTRDMKPDRVVEYRWFPWCYRLNDVGA